MRAATVMMRELDMALGELRGMRTIAPTAMMEKIARAAEPLLPYVEGHPNVAIGELDGLITHAKAVLTRFEQWRTGALTSGGSREYGL